MYSTEIGNKSLKLEILTFSFYCIVFVLNHICIVSYLDCNLFVSYPICIVVYYIFTVLSLYGMVYVLYHICIVLNGITFVLYHICIALNGITFVLYPICIYPICIYPICIVLYFKRSPTSKGIGPKGINGWFQRCVILSCRIRTHRGVKWKPVVKMGYKYWVKSCTKLSLESHLPFQLFFVLILCTNMENNSITLLPGSLPWTLMVFYGPISDNFADFNQKILWSNAFYDSLSPSSPPLFPGLGRKDKYNLSKMEKSFQGN